MVKLNIVVANMHAAAVLISRSYVIARTRQSIAEGMAASMIVTCFSRPPIPRINKIKNAKKGAISSLIIETENTASMFSFIPLNSSDNPKDIMIRGIAAPLR